MNKESMMTLPITEGNLMMAKAEALDILIDMNIVNRETVVNLASNDWCGIFS